MTEHLPFLHPGAIDIGGQKVPGLRYLTESVNYHMETIIIWKNIND
jgi:hypothetical protein